ncbi:ABC transporter ATP-binding protein [Roseibium sp.]|uniref:ABC transporter ATP-binding protein n=1 Tax=Roseibium sp. TaxID=1936156 RepID=UPI0032668A1C
MSILSVKDLDVRYGQFRAVRGVSFDIARGEILALVGANGAGKTTLLRALAGANPVYAGSVHLNGTDITQMPSHRRVAAGLALVPEGRRLFLDMTIEENLSLGRTAGRDGEWDIDRVLETFPNLVKRRHALTGTMSGGEQQATAIGRALMSNPDILILDEVSLGLSPLVVDQVYASLDGLLKTGTTIILVEQDLTRAMTVADRVICMLEGRVQLDSATTNTSRDAITDAYFGNSRRKEGLSA